MKFYEFLKDITAPKKADPKAFRNSEMKKKEFKINLKSLLVLFVVAVILLCSLSAVIVINEKEKEETSTALTDESESVTAQNAGTLTQNTGEAREYNILFAFTREKNEDLQLLLFANINNEQKQTTLSFVPEGVNCEVNNYKGSMKQHMKNGGITELLWAAGEYSGKSFERYVAVDEDGFLNIIKILGDFEYDIPQRVDADYNGVNFIIEKGRQIITADMLLKYFVYLSKNEIENKDELSRLFSAIAQGLTKEGTDESVKANYEKLVNYISTDISAIDIATFAPEILSMKEFN